MKKLVIVLFAFIAVVHCSDDPQSGPQQSLNLLNTELDELMDSFAQGQLLSDKAEKQMNMQVLPLFNWLGGVNTTNKKDPATVTPADVTSYNALFDQYSKTYGPDDELYNYYSFGKGLLGALASVNALKADIVRLKVTSADDIVGTMLIPGYVADAQSCVDAFSDYEDRSKKAVAGGFKKPFSVPLSTMYANELAIARRIISLNGVLVPPAPSATKPSTPPAAQKSAEEKAMDGILNPLLNAFSGSTTDSAADPDTFDPAQISTYQTAFDVYSKTHDSSSPGYWTYKCGTALLPALAAKNTLENDLISLGIGDVSDVEAAVVTPSLRVDAQTFSDAYAAFQAVLKQAPSSFTSPFPAHVGAQYADLLPIVAAIVATPLVVTPPPLPVVTETADSFIVNNFSDSTLSGLTADSLEAVLKKFASTYSTTDPFYAEYQVWSAYARVRYHQLDFLDTLQNQASATKVKAAGQAFRVNYLNGFRRTYLDQKSALHEPYASQLKNLALEFAITDELARVEIHEIDNNTFSL